VSDLHELRCPIFVDPAVYGDNRSVLPDFITVLILRCLDVVGKYGVYFMQLLLEKSAVDLEFRRDSQAIHRLDEVLSVFLAEGFALESVFEVFFNNVGVDEVGIDVLPKVPICLKRILGLVKSFFVTTVFKGRALRVARCLEMLDA
jgi:hypothetical protein